MSCSAVYRLKSGCLTRQRTGAVSVARQGRDRVQLIAFAPIIMIGLLWSAHSLRGGNRVVDCVNSLPPGAGRGRE
jgi:hypothetical protein